MDAFNNYKNIDIIMMLLVLWTGVTELFTRSTWIRFPCSFEYCTTFKNMGLFRLLGNSVAQLSFFPLTSDAPKAPA